LLAFTENPYPGVPQITTHIITDNQQFKIKELNIETIRLMHYKLPILGFKINNLAYLTDVKSIAETEKEKLKKLDVLILSALRREEHLSHFTLQEALDVIEELKPKRAYLTHLSHQMGKHSVVEKELPDHVKIAYDGLKIQF
jgi:phosphoribosyl 1,2-cyclic phosphate phosphodiesterase